MPPRRSLRALIMLTLTLLARPSDAQVLTGTLVGTVKDESGSVLPEPSPRLSSRALIAGRASTVTNQRGQFRLVSLRAGEDVLDVELSGFAVYHEDHITITVQGAFEQTVILNVGAIPESISVQAGTSVDEQRSSIASRFGQETLSAITVRRFSMFDLIRATPGVSPTSASSGADPSVSVFGSSMNENLYLLDGTNFRCRCSGGLQPQPDVDVIQEVHVDSIGPSAEFGNIHCGLFNVVTKPAETCPHRTSCTSGSIHAPSRRKPTNSQSGWNGTLPRRLSIAVPYVHKDGSDSIGWTESGAIYEATAHTLQHGQVVPVTVLTNGTAARRFLVTNPSGHFLRHDAMALTVERRWSDALTRILLETPGTRRLSSQTLLDVRLSRAIEPRSSHSNRTAARCLQCVQRHSRRAACR